MNRYSIALVLCTVVVVQLATAAPALAVTIINEYPGPTTLGLNDVTTGPDGNLWVVNNSGNQISKVSPAGAFLNNYTIPTASARPVRITTGSDGNVWFTEDQGGKVGRITTAGAITEFALPVSTSRPQGITPGPDCNLWFVERFPAKVGMITTTGAITEFPLSAISAASVGITAGADGNLWFTEYGANKIGRITPAGVITEFPVDTTVNGGGGGPSAITLGWDGNVWFEMEVSHAIGKITPSGTLSYYNLSLGSAASGGGITQGPDGNVWFSDPMVNKIGQISPTGTIVENSVPTASASPQGITTGPDGNVWFAEYGSGKIGQVNVGTPVFPGSPRNITVFAGDTIARLEWSTPFSTGGSPITSYTVTPYIGTTAQTPVNVAASPAVVTGLTDGVAYTFKVTANNIAGAGWPASPCGTTTPSSQQSVVSAQQYQLANSNGTSWVDIDTNKLRVNLAPNSGTTAVLGANADLWTANAGFNQDIGIFASVNGAADQLVAWKESGGFAGTFSPNAAFVQAVYPVAAGSTYVFKLKWKTNKNAPGATIFAGAGPIGGQFSPTRLMVQQVSAANTFDAVSNQQYLLGGNNGTAWVEFDSTLRVNYTSGVTGTWVLGANVDLWTANAGYNQDIGIFVSVSGGADQLVAWKESGGFAGTYSPNAAFVQATWPSNPSIQYIFKLKWKTNKNATGATILAGAGSVGNFSPTRLTAQLKVGAFNDVVSTQQYNQASSNGTTWTVIGGTSLQTSPLSFCCTMAMIVGANVDLFTGSAGYNQDIGIFVSVNGGVDELVAWKESGGFAGTFSPNAAFVQGVYIATPGNNYTFKLKWKTNKNAAGATIYAGAGPIGGLFSPTRLSVDPVV